MLRQCSRLRPASRRYALGSGRLLANRRTYVYPEQGVFQPNSPPRPDLFPEQRQGTFDPLSSNGAPSQPQRYPKRSTIVRVVRALIYLTAFGLGFQATDDLITAHLAPNPPLAAGSEEDLARWEELDAELNDLPQYQALLARSQYGEGNPEWRHWYAYSGFENDPRREMRLTTGPLSGTEGVEAQALFWNEAKKTLVLFINFGNGMCGFPGFVHGGALATICDEALGRVAIRNLPQNAGVTANLEINYRAPVRPQRWYILTAALDPSRASTDNKKYVAAAMAEADRFILGNMIVKSASKPSLEARGLFVAPKGMKLPPLVDDF